jgi:hypothetical protein
MPELMYRMPDFLAKDFAALAAHEGIEPVELLERTLEEFFAWYAGPERGQRWLPLGVPQPNKRVYVELPKAVVFRVDQAARAHNTKAYDIVYTAIKRYMDERIEGVDTMEIRTQQMARLQIDEEFADRITRCVEGRPEEFGSKQEFYEKAAKAWLTRRFDRFDERYNYRKPPNLPTAVSLAVTMPNPLGRLIAAAIEEDGVSKKDVFYNILLDYLDACEGQAWGAGS